MAESIKGKRIVILGLARQGTALARWAARSGAIVTVSDVRSADALKDAISSLDGLPIRYVLGSHPLELLDDCDLLCLSGGVPTSLPIVAEARERSIPLSNDTLLFLERSPAPVVGITGSSGKTTTTTLVGEMLKASGYKTWVGGNIGLPLIDHLDEIGSTDKVVLELSSFQLELYDRSPQVASVLNVTPNHLDRHPSMSHYTAAKANILKWQTESDYAVLGADNHVTGKWLAAKRVRIPAGEGQAEVDFPIRSRAYGFSLNEMEGEGAFRNRKGELVLSLEGKSEVICHRSDLKLRGEHNVANVLAAALTAKLAGATIGGIREAATAFKGVPHRLEEVRRWKGALWINDSIATTPERAIAALKSFDEPIILLSGGRDKHLPWGEYSRLVHEKVEHLILFGEAAELIARNVAAARDGDSSLRSVTMCGSLEEAVQTAAEKAEPGDVVLLSPGGTSFDAYRDFAERGEHFRKLVQEL